uniref:Uncharacterized protein n=1 Tax=Rhizophora mucronata TaxID=61149 RepID=A0A2P2NA06_RHIMU
MCALAPLLSVCMTYPLQIN